MDRPIRLSARTFSDQFARFEERVKGKSGESFRSFRDGLPDREEGYKEEVRKYALFRLALSEWRRSDIGNGAILQRVIDSIELPDAPYNLKNNLVSWHARFGPKSRHHRRLLDGRSDPAARLDFERWFFEFFHKGEPAADAFEQFLGLAGNNYDLVAYLFFLKDWRRFMPIAPTTFDKAFKLLGIGLVTSGRSSWQNYADYNDALRAVQFELQHEVPDVRLVDAHSFCWILARMEPGPARIEMTIEAPLLLSDLQLGPPPSDAVETIDSSSVFDEEQFAQLDVARRRLGRKAEEIALESERIRLKRFGHPDPVGGARSVSNEPSRGYDILSCESDDTPRHIEVKAARQSGRKLSFFVSRNEWRRSRHLSNYHFYLVLGVDSPNPIVRDVPSDSVTEELLTPETYIASFMRSEQDPP